MTQYIFKVYFYYVCMVSIFKSFFPKLSKSKKTNSGRNFSESDLDNLFDLALNNLWNILIIDGESKDFYEYISNIEMALKSLKNLGNKNMNYINVININVAEFEINNSSNLFFIEFKRNYSKILSLLK